MSHDARTWKTRPAKVRKIGGADEVFCGRGPPDVLRVPHVLYDEVFDNRFDPKARRRRAKVFEFEFRTLVGRQKMSLRDSQAGRYRIHDAGIQGVKVVHVKPLIVFSLRFQSEARRATDAPPNRCT